MALHVGSLMPYVPAKDFELSKRFYAALGFSMSAGWGGTVDFSLDGHAFRLQDYYVREWADNFMFVIGVDDVAAWHTHARALLDSHEFAGMRVKAPEPVDDSIGFARLGSEWGPAGVCPVSARVPGHRHVTAHPAMPSWGSAFPGGTDASVHRLHSRGSVLSEQRS